VSVEFDEEAGPGHGHFHADAIGSIGLEASKLLAAAQEWAQQAFGAGTEARPGAEAEPAATTCEWCPICQFVAVLRGERPETTEKIATAGAAMLTVLRSLLDAIQSPASSPSSPESPQAQPPGGRVQPIDLGAE